jgi:hypothetical protein
MAAPTLSVLENVNSVNRAQFTSVPELLYRTIAGESSACYDEGEKFVVCKKYHGEVMKNYYTTPNNIFDLGLDSYEFHIYSYLVCLAGSKNICWPSVAHIARKLDLSENTVIKKVNRLIDLRLIDKQICVRDTKSGKKRRANNRYHICPLEDVFEHRSHLRSG